MTTLATITSKNQLTIPQEVLDYLQWQDTRRVLISTDNQTLQIRSLEPKSESLAGSLSFLSLSNSLSFKKIREKVKSAVASQAAREGL